MIEETGQVKKVSGQTVWIETQIKTTCGTCHVNQNCGTSVVAKAFTAKPELLELSSPYELVEGQIVKLGIPEKQLLTASMMMYLLPIVVLIVSASALQLLLPSLHEIFRVLFAFGATGLSFLYVAFVAKKQDKGQFAPIILGAVNELGKTLKNEIPVKKIS